MIRISLQPSKASDPRAIQLLNEFPRSVANHAFLGFETEKNDPEVQHFLARAGEFGLRPWRDKSRPIDRLSKFSCDIYRTYDRTDLNNSRLLQMIVPYRDDMQIGYITDLIRVQVPRLPRKIVFRVFNGRRPACGERLKCVLDAAGLKGLRLDPGVRALYRGRAAPVVEPYGPDEERWYALGSDVIMPPVGPPLIKFDHTFKNRVERNYAGDSNFREDGFDDYELHYPKSEVDALGNFDAALMYEGRPDASLIVSRRFWLACDLNNIACEFKPVKIDP